MTALPNPLVPGFNPDPSVVLVDDTYYLVTSTFEYLPGIPVYRSTDLVSWEHLGNVATRAEQVAVADAPTGGGVWAPTIRHHDGLFYVIVTVAMSPKGCVVFTAEDPAGPWSDGVTIQGVPGIDPDLAWDDDGTAYVTFSGLSTTGEDLGAHKGIQQVRVDLETGTALEEPRSLWSGTGLKFPEAPHLYSHDGRWYLVIAEGGTERGHSVSVARSSSPTGPFEGDPANPILSAKGTDRPIQNTGHADLLQTVDGEWVLVMLGMRPLGMTQSFSPLGRETFATPASWVDGWLRAERVQLAPRAEAVEEDFDLRDPEALADPGWLAVRALPADVVSSPGEGGLALRGDGSTLDDPRPRFLGRRQRHLTASFSTTVDAGSGEGGLGFRYDEEHHVSLTARGTGEGTVVTAVAALAGVRQAWEATLPAGPVRLRIETRPPSGGFTPEAAGGDRVRLVAGDTVLAELDGRYWTAETCASFTGRVAGIFAVAGEVVFADLHYRGSDAP